MTEQFEELLKSFKPQFGNMNHIKVYEMVTRLRKKEALIKEKLKNQETIDKKLKEIEQDERQIAFLIRSVNE